MSLREPVRTRSLLARALQLVLVVIGTAPLWAAALHRTAPFSSSALLAERWFRFQCERDVARSLELFGNVLPVCARCTGIYFGLATGALLARPRLGTLALRIWLLAASAFMLFDVLSEAWGFRPAWASLRLATGALFAYPVGVALVQLLRDRIRDRARAESRRPCSGPSTSD